MSLSQERRTELRRLSEHQARLWLIACSGGTTEDELDLNQTPAAADVYGPWQRELETAGDELDAARDLLTAVRSLVENATDPRVALADIAALLKASDQ
jgi:hypothetical protein